MTKHNVKMRKEKIGIISSGSTSESSAVKGMGSGGTGWLRKFGRYRPCILACELMERCLDSGYFST
jgi:hypothetical protein